MALYGNAGGQGATPDTGYNMGAQLYGAELAARTHYAAPTVPAPASAQLASGGSATNIANAGLSDAGYNYQPGQPVKYDVPSAAKERLQARSQIRQAAALEGGAQRIDPIHDEEVDYLQSMQKQAELADFDAYVNSLIDVRKPGNLKWLMEIYPEYVNRRIQQVHTDYEFALRNQMIDSWGINTFDDLHFKYLVDQGKVDGPRLGRHANLGDEYAPGLLSPWTFVRGRPDGVRLPYASATEGRKPAAPRDWELGATPLNTGRSGAAMAASIYNGDTPFLANDRRALGNIGPAVSARDAGNGFGRN